MELLTFDSKIIIAHEKKHRENKNFGDIRRLGQNFYETVLLDAFDEISATTAGFMTQAPDNSPYSVTASVICGTKSFLKNIDEYSTQHISRMIVPPVPYSNQPSPEFISALYDFDKKCKIVYPQYSRQFHKTVNKYMTFNNISLSQLETNPGYMYIRENIMQIRNHYEHLIYDTMFSR